MRTPKGVSKVQGHSLSLWMAQFALRKKVDPNNASSYYLLGWEGAEKRRATNKKEKDVYDGKLRSAIMKKMKLALDLQSLHIAGNKININPNTQNSP
jgi:hypothetical protein